MNIEKILAEAPEGATHCTDTTPSMNLYAKVEHLGGFYVRLSNRWESYPIYAGIHLLDDLREIQRLRADNETLRNDNSHSALRAMIQRLENENEALRESIPKLKADAVRDAVNFASTNFEGKNFCHACDLYMYADNLESQAAKGE